MNLLIIGGSGHVSGALANAAVAAGHTVWTVTRGRRPLPAGVSGLVADRQEPGSLEKAIAAAGRTWDMVVDCIAFDAPALQQDLALFRNRAAHLAFISTDFVYDPARRRFPQPEEPACYVESESGASPYGFKKRRAEKVLLESDTGSLAWTVLRPCHIYGPTSELGCLPLHGRDKQLIAKLRAGEPLKLAGGGHFLQQPILAADLAQAVLSVSRAYYQIIANVLGVELKVEEVAVAGLLREHPDMAPFLCHRIYDRAAMRDAGLTLPATPLVDGLRQHVEGLLGRIANS
jgi:nucleoside-diphosphate-sugar epimerase